MALDTGDRAAVGRRVLVVLTAAGLVTATLAALAGAGLRHQAALARRRIGKPLGEQAPGADRVWRPKLPGEPVDVLVLGDSIAAGLGAERRKDTLGARLAKAAARDLRRPVRLRVAAVVGSESSALGPQLDALPAGYRPRVAVIVVGGNDVTHRIPVSVSVTHLTEAIARLRALGAEVVVGTCPDLGALRPVPQPLRSLASRLSRQLAAAQGAAAEHQGAEAVPLGRLVGPMFLDAPEEMFSLDRFHPSALGYRRTAEVLLPAVLRAVSDAAASATRDAPADQTGAVPASVRQ